MIKIYPHESAKTLFSITGAEEIRAYGNEQLRSVAARRLGFLYEWLTGKELDTAASRKAAYVPVLDESQHFGMALDASARNEKYRAIDNLPGNRSFCPLVSKTQHLSEAVNQDLRREARERLARYPADLLKRAAAYLYLKETRSSFEERPSPDKAQRFVDLLRQAEIGQLLSEDRLIELQNAVRSALPRSILSHAAELYWRRVRLHRTSRVRAASSGRRS